MDGSRFIIFKKVLTRYKELAREEQVTKAADVYSFAVVVWEMLTGELPWKGDLQR